MSRPEEENPRAKRRGLPLLVGATLLALAISAVPALQHSAAMSRDQRRLGAIYDVNRAIAAYVRQHGEPPPHVPDPLAGGWETSRNGCFLDLLVVEGHLESTRLDPLNDSAYQFCYHRYEAGEYGSDEPFYVLAVTAFEDADTELGLRAGGYELAQGGRNWSAEFALALGGE
jgi:hypothetical protein